MLLWHEVKLTVALPLGPKDTLKNGESQFLLDIETIFVLTQCLPIGSKALCVPCCIQMNQT